MFGSLLTTTENHPQQKENKTLSDINIEPGKPIILELEPGTYYRCTCGNSANMPFSDESCKESGCTPVHFEIKEKQQVYLCNCGKTSNGPFCDGSCAK
jgi:CDGSH-type Zn-finger protein